MKTKEETPTNSMVTAAQKTDPKIKPKSMRGISPLIKSNGLLCNTGEMPQPSNPNSGQNSTKGMRQNSTRQNSNRGTVQNNTDKLENMLGTGGAKSLAMNQISN